MVQAWRPPHKGKPYKIPGDALKREYAWKNSGQVFLEYPGQGPGAFDSLPGRSIQAIDSTIEPSTSIVVIQLANPFDRPLPLFDVNPKTGLLDRTLPLYKLRLFGQQIVLGDNPLDPSAPTEEYPLLTMASKKGYMRGGEHPWDPNNPSAGGAPPRLPLYLPPATPEAPYTLVLYASGIAEDWDNPAEEEQWLDFLDIEPVDHFFRPGFVPSELNGSTFIDPHNFKLVRDIDGNGTPDRIEPWGLEPGAGGLGVEVSQGFQEIFPGDLICQVGNASIKPWATNRAGYDKNNADGNQDGIPDGMAIELIRTHRADFNGNKVYTENISMGLSTAPIAYDYQVDVVIDRTGAPLYNSTGVPQSPYDEFHNVVTQKLPAERPADTCRVGVLAKSDEGHSVDSS